MELGVPTLRDEEGKLKSASGATKEGVPDGRPILGMLTDDA